MGVYTIDPRDLSQPELHRYLLSAVAPRPICLASTIDTDGNVNLSPFSFFNVFSSNPPIMVFSPARGGSNNANKHTFLNIDEVKEVVINIVNYPIVEQMSLSSTSYNKGVNEFVKAGFTQIKSTKVRPPRVGEAPVAFECGVDNVIELGNGPGAGNLIIARVKLIHIQEKYLDVNGMLDTTALDLVARMGGSWYCRASGDALFEIPKPLKIRGIGVDQLPQSIKMSTVLTGNNLGRLGNMEQLPSAYEVHSVKEMEEVRDLLQQNYESPFLTKIALHRLAKKWIDNGNSDIAIRVLMLADELTQE
ncbi:MAG: flavin reductase (DIM6/NTAB) family NADH-FMN oxidoreductase RutF [Saprospiraceae bacterium]|jgi:flavin reductase (DIM6/NTAB) family NADH-FMN oxidoreductase RutF